jgi:hypothetical protein
MLTRTVGTPMPLDAISALSSSAARLVKMVQLQAAIKSESSQLETF